MQPPCSLRAAVLVLALTAQAAAAPPIVLYDPASSAPAVPGADLKSTTTTPSSQAQPCGLTTPCTDLNTATNANISAPFYSSIPMGLSGEASAGVSNHGQGGSIGVLGWIKPTDDSTIYVGLSVGASRWNGQKVTVLPVSPHP